jgi:hypothetical protein
MLRSVVGVENGNPGITELTGHELQLQLAVEKVRQELPDAREDEVREEDEDDEIASHILRHNPHLIKELARHVVQKKVLYNAIEMMACTDVTPEQMVVLGRKHSYRLLYQYSGSAAALLNALLKQLRHENENPWASQAVDAMSH